MSLLEGFLCLLFAVGVFASALGGIVLGIMVVAFWKNRKGRKDRNK